MPHCSPERELSYASRVTERLLASATEVVCSYPLFSGEEKLRASPLIESAARSPGIRCRIRRALAQNFRGGGSA